MAHTEPPSEPQGHILIRVISKLATGFAGACVIAGTSLALLLMLELGVRAFGALDPRAQGDSADALGFGLPGGRDHIYADSSWGDAFSQERSAPDFRWEPFVYVRLRSYAGRYVNVDSAGLRVTPQYPVPGGKPLRVHFFGGSTTWGYAQRDSATRVAQVARHLADRGYDARVVNFGQLLYVSPQNLVTLVRELKRGPVPDAVVFWEGANEVGSAWLNQRPDVSYREADREADLLFGTARRRHSRMLTPFAVETLLTHSRLYRSLVRLSERAPAVPPVPADPAPFCRNAMGEWLQHARVIDRLADAYGFVALVIWQPQWSTSNRPVTKYEREVAAHSWNMPEHEELSRLDRECARVADSLVDARAARSILNWAGLHRRDTSTVFVDGYDHVTERVAALQADTLTKILMTRLQERGTRRMAARAGRETVASAQ